jgi:hypothetical protein
LESGHELAAAAIAMTDIATIEGGLLVLGPAAVLAALISAGLIVALSPLLRDYAHRTHFYQRATDGGFTVSGIVARVFTLNLLLAALALLTVVEPQGIVSAIALAIGAALGGSLLANFARGKKT